MTTDCSLNYKFNTWKFQAQTWGEHVVYRNWFWHSEQFLHTTCSPHVLQKEELLTKIYLYIKNEKLVIFLPFTFLSLFFFFFKIVVCIKIKMSKIVMFFKFSRLFLSTLTSLKPQTSLDGFVIPRWSLPSTQIKRHLTDWEEAGPSRTDFYWV